MAVKKLSAPLLLLFLFSCTLDYSEADLTEELSEDIPDMVISDYESVEVRNGSPVLKITAGDASFYNKKEETHLSDVEFYNYDDDEITNHGKTDKAVLHMVSGDATMTGSILIESTEDDSSLEAESLQWIDNEKKLSSQSDHAVSVKDKDGSRMEGRGFSADIRRNSIVFEGEIDGEFISE